ncbi:MAG: hypothetical protein Q4G36_05285 [Paracoccus sp. (in: a-proteobacteria)]|nr:hypothetical protein [Paracoccus sp. (in: a-proteobacteria)]
MKYLALLAMLTASPALADNGWSSGFERGVPYHVLTLDSLRLTVICDKEQSRGRADPGMILVQIGGSGHETSGPVQITSGAQTARLNLSYGTILERETAPADWARAVALLSSDQAVTITIGHQAWAFRNPAPRDIGC